MNLTRQREVFDVSAFNREKIPVHIIGCGAIGSWIAVNMVKIGVSKVNLYDMDTVEEHNIPNQAFNPAHIGMAKVDALKEILTAINPDCKVTTEKVRVTSASHTKLKMKGVVILAVDSMKARETIYNSLVYLNPHCKLMLDARMGSDIVRLYSILPSNIAHLDTYKSTLYSDDVTEESICGLSISVGPTAMIAASMLTWNFIDFAKSISDTSLTPVSYVEKIVDVRNIESSMCI